MPVPTSARRHYRWSGLLATRAVREAKKVRPRGSAAVAGVVALHQVTAARQAPIAVDEMLAEQSIEAAMQAALNALSFVTVPEQVEAMVDTASVDHEFERIVAGLVQDASRAAEQVAGVVSAATGWVRYLSPPSCGRCAVLAGRVYRYDEPLPRHPGCDCINIPTSIANPAFIHDPVDLARQGLVKGLSKADQRAIADGADLSQVVNVRSKRAGLSTSDGVLIRAGRPTPAGIYAAAASREDAIERLIAAGYIR